MTLVSLDNVEAKLHGTKTEQLRNYGTKDIAGNFGEIICRAS